MSCILRLTARRHTTSAATAASLWSRSFFTLPLDRRSSYLLIPEDRLAAAPSPLFPQVRYISKQSKKDKKSDEDRTAVVEEPLEDEEFLPTAPPLSADYEDDPFGVHFQDTNKLGPDLPPKYKRDAATGRLTGDVEHELSPRDRQILQADDLELDRLLLQNVQKDWETSDENDDDKLNSLGAQVRKANMALNVLGRSVAAQASQEALDDGTMMGRDDSGFSQHLTPREFESLQRFLKEQVGADIVVTEDDIPVQKSPVARKNKPSTTTEQQKQQDETKEEASIDADKDDLALKWLTARAQRQMDDSVDDNPYADLIPSDFSPMRLVNRKRAKPIPVSLLHHNNMDLLQRFISPMGQIKTRVQSRLGARDQRRVAKLIKRARCLGLIPYQGQFKAEQHGWVHDPEIQQDRDWEKELVKRGLVVKEKTEP